MIVNPSALDSITKEDMLDTIDNLIVCLQGPSEIALEDLLDSQLQWMDIRDLQEFYRETTWDFYMEHPLVFSEDFYYEFIQQN